MATKMVSPMQQLLRPGYSYQQSYKLRPSAAQVDESLSQAGIPTLPQYVPGPNGTTVLASTQIAPSFYPDEEAHRAKLEEIQSLLAAQPSQIDLSPIQTISQLLSVNPQALPNAYKAQNTVDDKLKEHMGLLDMIQGSRDSEFKRKEEMLKLLTGIEGTSGSESQSMAAPQQPRYNMGRGDEVDLKELGKRLNPALVSGFFQKVDSVKKLIGDFDEANNKEIKGLGQYGLGDIKRLVPGTKDYEEANKNWANIVDLTAQAKRIQSGTAVTPSEAEQFMQQSGISRTSPPSVLRGWIAKEIRTTQETIDGVKAGFTPEVIRMYESNPAAIKSERFAPMLAPGNAGNKPAGQGAPKSPKDMSLDELKALRDQLKGG